MDKEVKDNLLFSMYTGESLSYTGSNMAKYITDKMRTIYDGYWSVFATPFNRDHKFDWTDGYYAHFYYENYFWYVYKNDCEPHQPKNMSLPASNVSNYSVAIPYKGSDIVKFDQTTTMGEKVREDLRSAIFVSQESGLPNSYTVKCVYERMQRIYGGGWSVHVGSLSVVNYVNTSSIMDHYAKFTYNGSVWVIFQQLCNGQLYSPSFGV